MMDNYYVIDTVYHVVFIEHKEHGSIKIITEIIIDVLKA